MKIKGRGIQSVEVGGQVLRALAEFGRPMALRDVASLANIPPAQAHAYLVSFRNTNLVEQEPVGGLYRLGSFALTLGLARMKAFEPLRLSEQAAQELSIQTGAMVTVSVWSIHGACIASIHEGSYEVPANLRSGAIYSLLTTTAGGIFLSYLPEDITGPFLQSESERCRKPHEKIELRERLQRVKQIKRLGYCAEQEGPTPGLSNLSVPVFGYDGLEVVLTLIGPSKFINVDTDSPLVGEAVNAARMVSTRLGNT